MPLPPCRVGAQVGLTRQMPLAASKRPACQTRPRLAVRVAGPLEWVRAGVCGAWAECARKHSLSGSDPSRTPHADAPEETGQRSLRLCEETGQRSLRLCEETGQRSLRLHEERLRLQRYVLGIACCCCRSCWHERHASCVFPRRKLTRTWLVRTRRGLSDLLALSAVHGPACWCLPCCRHRPHHHRYCCWPIQIVPGVAGAMRRQP
jgi:hypothetical protein